MPSRSWSLKCSVSKDSYFVGKLNVLCYPAPFNSYSHIRNKGTEFQVSVKIEINFGTQLPIKYVCKWN